jgi:hypothetical protein
MHTMLGSGTAQVGGSGAENIVATLSSTTEEVSMVGAHERRDCLAEFSAALKQLLLGVPETVFGSALR